jgi:hypothetical protein
MWFYARKHLYVAFKHFHLILVSHDIFRPEILQEELESAYNAKLQQSKNSLNW